MSLKRLFLIVFSVVYLVGLSSVAIYSQSSEQVLEKKQQEIEELKQKISQLQGEKKTLQSTINYLNSKINLTEIQIDHTEDELDVITKEIDELTNKIVIIDASLEELTQQLLYRVNQTYKRSRINPFYAIVSADTVKQLVSRFKYLQLVEQFNKELVVELETARTDFDQQKTLKEVKQKELDELTEQLESQKKVLGVQEQEKESLLQQTKNDEAKYQDLLAQALAEKAAIENALASSVKVGSVKTGDVIGLVGNSGYPGCSTGKHLHFEVRKNDTWVNPTSYLQNKSVLDEELGSNTNIGTGSWPWPIADTVRLTQHFGQTPYSWRYTYSGGIHTGFDMVSTSSDLIKAPADGTLFKSSQSCGSSSTINIVYIEHAEDVRTFYLHIQ